MSRRILYCWLLTLIVLAGFILRVHALDRYDFWFDELTTIQYTHQEVLEHFNLSRSIAPEFHLPATLSGYFIRLLSFDYHSFLYYLFVYCFSMLFPDQMALRALSVFWGIASLWLFYRVTRKFMSRPESLGAVAIMAASSFHIWYAQQARGFTAFCFFFLLAVYAYLRLRKHHNRMWLLGFLITSAIAVMFSYFSVFIIFLFLEYICDRKKASFSALWPFVVIATLLSIIQFPMIAQQISSLSQGKFWLHSPSFSDFISLPGIFIGGYLSQPWQLWAGGFLCWGLLFRGMHFLYTNDRHKFTILSLLTVVPLLSVLCLATLFTPVFIARHLIIFSPFFYMILVYGIISFQQKWGRVLLIAFLAIFLILGWLNYKQGTILHVTGGRDFYPGVHEHKRYMPLMKHVADNLRSDEKVVVTDIQASLFLYRVLSAQNMLAGQRVIMFYPELLSPFDLEYFQRWSFDTKFDDKQTLYGLIYPDRHIKISKATWDPESFWLVGSSWENDDFFGNNFFAVKEVITKDYVLVDSLEHDGVFIGHYKKSLYH